MRSSVKQLCSLVSLCVVLASGCSRAPADSGDHGPITAALEQTQLQQAVVTRAKSAPDELVGRASNLVSILVARSLAPNESLDALRAQVSRGGAADVAVDGLPGVSVQHSEDGYLTVVNSEVTQNRNPNSVDVGEAKARESFKAVFDELVKQELVDPTAYQAERATLGRVRFGAAAVGQAPTEFTKEYRFYVKQQQNGIDASEGEIRVGVHRTGALSMIRVGGPTLAAAPNAAAVETKVAVASLDERFKQEFPQAQLISSGLKYRLAARDGEVIEPQQAYEFVPQVKLSNGDVEVGRRVTVYYSLVESGSPGVLHPAPEPLARGDRPRN